MESINNGKSSRQSSKEGVEIENIVKLHKNIIDLQVETHIDDLVKDELALPIIYIDITNKEDNGVYTLSESNQYVNKEGKTLALDGLTVVKSLRFSVKVDNVSNKTELLLGTSDVKEAHIVLFKEVSPKVKSMTLVEENKEFSELLCLVRIKSEDAEFNITEFLEDITCISEELVKDHRSLSGLVLMELIKSTKHPLAPVVLLYEGLPGQTTEFAKRVTGYIEQPQEVQSCSEDPALLTEAHRLIKDFQAIVAQKDSKHIKDVVHKFYEQTTISPNILDLLISLKEEQEEYTLESQQQLDEVKKREFELEFLQGLKKEFLQYLDFSIHFNVNAVNMTACLTEKTYSNIYNSLFKLLQGVE